jgi:hypothetical protein
MTESHFICQHRQLVAYEWYCCLLSSSQTEIHIFITITILDIVHRPVFYLKLNSTLYICPYLTGNTLRLRYEPNELMLSIGLWRWYINITITILDIIHRSCLFLKHDVPETGFPLRLQVDPTHLDITNETGLCLRSPARILSVAKVSSF